MHDDYTATFIGGGYDDVWVFGELCEGLCVSFGQCFFVWLGDGSEDDSLGKAFREIWVPVVVVSEDGVSGWVSVNSCGEFKAEAQGFHFSV